jgi:ribulose bisphosphate carboxylase small subunit
MWTFAVLVLAAALITGYLYFSRSTSPIPDAIQQQLTFSPFVLPSDTADITTSDYAYTTAEERVQVFSFVVHLPEGKVTVSEYIQPPEFTDITEYRERFLTNIAKQYATVPTSNGTIYLGRLSLQDNKQVGILLERGLLVFMNPDKEISETTWRQLGDQLEIQKVVN